MFDINIIQSNNILGEGGFYLHSSNEVVWLDLLKPSISFLNLNKNLFIKEKLNLKTPLGNIYPILTLNLKLRYLLTLLILRKIFQINL